MQPNCPYPATPHLVGYLKSRGGVAFQRDLSAKVARDILVEYGDETTEELLEFLSGPAPAEAKLEASRRIDDLAMRIRDEIDPAFGFSRYAERIGAFAADFGAVEKEVKRPGVVDRPLEKRLEAAIAETRPTEIGVTCPFPGTLIPAFKIARYVRRHYPKIRLVLGGGFVSTELRTMTDKRPYRYFDEFQLDEGYSQWANGEVPPFVEPSYEGIDWNDYFDVVEDVNPMHRIWSVGRWRKLVMARGCYWHKCAFCDVKLPYIGCFEMPKAKAIVDAMEHLGRSFHFVDEAMPPKLLAEVSREILRRKFECEWWGNVRFDAAYTPELARLMAASGCIAVTGGLECANDRLLKLMNKGITLASAERALRAFKRAGILVHAYLMYDFPTETKREEREARRYVRTLAKRGLVQSVFWHRFALTVHSPIAANPEAFGIELEPIDRRRRFALNEIPYRRRKMV